MRSFGIIGAGMIADTHAQAIRAMRNGSLIGIYGRNFQKAQALAERYQCQAFPDLGGLLNEPDLDIVTIATPSGAHLQPVVDAARAGKHIICEKPLEITPDRIDQMSAACHEAGVVLSGIFNRRFNSAVACLKKAIDERRFGKLTLCDAQVKWYRTPEYYASGAWRGTKELDGGGALMNQAIHTIDLLLYLAGNVRRVSATTTRIVHRNIEVEDTAVAILEFENGALGTLQGSTACWSSTGHPAEIQICGSDGSVFLTDDYFRVWDFRQVLPEDEEIQKVLIRSGISGLGANDPAAINYLGHQRNFEDVVEALDKGRPPAISASEARKSVALIDAIYRSAAQQGMWISL